MTRRPADWRCGLVVLCWLVASGPAAAVVFANGVNARTGGDRQSFIGVVARGDDSVTGTRFGELVRAAASDPAALEQLRQVRRVDGRAVDMSFALAGPDREVRQRLRALTATVGAGSSTAAPAGSSSGARKDAARVLAGDKYRSHDVPRPLRGVLDWLGDRLDSLVRPIARLLGRLADTALGGLVIVGVLVAVTIAGARRLIAGRSRAAIERLGAHELVDLGVDPELLDRRAAEAAASGDHRGAVRLRYQAGLIRLHREGRITLRPDTTAAGVAAQVDSPALDRLTTDFEEIVYGGRPAGPADEASSLAGWVSVLGARSSR